MFVRRFCVALILGLALGSDRSGLAEGPSALSNAAPQWIWFGNPPQGEKVWFRRKISVEGDVKQARLAATCDNRFTIFINGRQALTGDNWQELSSADVAHLLHPGENIVSAVCTNEGGAKAFIARLEFLDASGKNSLLVSDKSWRSSDIADANFSKPEFNDSNWIAASEIGPVGHSGLPWSGAIDAAMLMAATRATHLPAGSVALPAENVTAPDGFRVEELFHVPRAMGSWVALMSDNKGRLIASDQGASGLYLITPAKISDPNSETTVEKLPVELSGAQGLVWAYDSLYAMVNEGKTGLHRVKDTNDDGKVDADEYLMPIEGSGEHGPHAVIQSPDSKSLFAISGNETKLPRSLAGSRMPQSWGEDLLLPRRWDAGGHAVGVLAQVDGFARSIQVASIGTYLALASAINTISPSMQMASSLPTTLTWNGTLARLGTNRRECVT